MQLRLSSLILPRFLKLLGPFYDYLDGGCLPLKEKQALSSASDGETLIAVSDGE